MTEVTQSHTNTKCKSMLGTLSDYIDRELEAELCREIERHVAECENCRIVVDTIRRTVELVQVSNPNEEALPEDVRSRLYMRLDLTEYMKGGVKP